MCIPQGVQAPFFCRSVMTGSPDPSATYGTYHQSTHLKRVLGTQHRARHLARLQRCSLGEQTLPIASPLGFPSVSPLGAFPLAPFAASSAVARLVCALQPALCSQAAPSHLLPPHDNILLPSCFWTWASLRSSHEAVVAFLIFSCRQFLQQHLLVQQTTVPCPVLGTWPQVFLSKYLHVLLI